MNRVTSQSPSSSLYCSYWSFSFSSPFLFLITITKRRRGRILHLQVSRSFSFPPSTRQESCLTLAFSSSPWWPTMTSLASYRKKSRWASKWPHSKPAKTTDSTRSSHSSCQIKKTTFGAHWLYLARQLHWVDGWTKKYHHCLRFRIATTPLPLSRETMVVSSPVRRRLKARHEISL